MKEEIDWSQRDQELQALCDQYRSSDGSTMLLFLLAVGRFSICAHLLKYKYGMNPLQLLGSLIFIQMLGLLICLDD